MQYAKDSSRTVQFSPEGTILLEDTSLANPLCELLRSNMGISHLFQMQEQVLSHILDVSAKRLIGDVILCAPTGSGKTLAYALPIVQSLLGRKIPRLRAIVVVPTRDLAIQVSKVFENLAMNLGITVGVISGASSIATETSLLSKTEILIATPGRLVDHMENGEGLSLREVGHLVMDESDRLLQESYQSWIEFIIPALGKRQRFVSSIDETGSGSDVERPKGIPTTGLLAMAIQPKVSALSFSRASEMSENVHKILVSATQTKNPKRLVQLGLRRPTFFEPMANSDELGSGLDSGYSIPSTMSESGWVIPDINDKPTALAKILGWIRTEEPVPRRWGNMVLPLGGVKLIFTKSVESAHRLCRLLQLSAYRLGIPGDVLEMSGELSTRKRQQVVRAIQSSTTAEGNHNRRFFIVVCSDVLARGMDMINVDAVINYDTPIHVRTYIHRAGRTARAGRTGSVLTLLLSKQAHHFRAMMKQADRGGRKVLVKNFELHAIEQSFLFSTLAHGLALLKRILDREKLGLFAPDEALPDYALYELWAKADATLEGPDEPKSEDSEAAPHRSGASKKRKWEGNNTKAKPTITSTNEEETADGEEIANDDLCDVLFFQIARNMLSS